MKKLKKTKFRCVECDKVHKVADGVYLYCNGVEALHCANCFSIKKISWLLEDARLRVLNFNGDGDALFSVLDDIENTFCYFKR